MTSCDAGRMTFFSLKNKPTTYFFQSVAGATRMFFFFQAGQSTGHEHGAKEMPIPCTERIAFLAVCTYLWGVLCCCSPLCLHAFGPPSPGRSPERRCTIREQGIKLKTQIDLLTNGAAAGAAAVRAVRDEIKGLTSAVYEGRKHFEQTTGAPKMVKKTAFSRGSSSIHG